MKKQIALFSIFFAIAIHYAFAQNNENIFEPGGKPIITVFSNFYAGLSNGNRSSAFEVNRAYLGYSYQLTPTIEVIVKLDIGSPGDQSQYARIRRYAYFKNAAMIYQKKQLKISAGMIDLVHFKMAEKMWRHRYIYKSFADEHNFGASADIGISVEYEITDKISVDASLINGEGYASQQIDEVYKQGVGVKLFPFSNFEMRFYYDLVFGEHNQSTIFAYTGYKTEKLAAGFDFNYRINNEFENDFNLSGYSGYISYNFMERMQLFGRYDYLTSYKLEGQNNPWNIARDGSAIIAGLQFTANNHVKLALNYQDWYPLAKNLDNELFIFLNLQCKL